jgi:hypothetical protein
MNTRRGLANLLLEHFFDLPDLFLNFADVVFGFAFNHQVRIVRDFACCLFDFAFHFMKTAFNLILAYWGSSVFSLSPNNIKSLHPHV